MRQFKDFIYLFSTVVFTLFFIAARPSFAGSELEGMVLKNEKQIEDYLKLLEKHFPRLFTNLGGGYYITPRTSLPDEQVFLQWYLRPEILAEMEKQAPPRLPMKRINLEVLSQQMQRGLTLSESALRELSTDFIEMNDKLSTPEKFQAKLISYFEKLGAVSSHGLLTGLVNCLPQELKAEAFKADLDNKIRILKENLTDEMVEKKFKGDGEKTAKAKLSEMKAALKAENKIVKLALFLYWQQDRNIQSIPPALGVSKTEFSEFLANKLKDIVDARTVKRVRDLVSSNVQNLFEGEFVEGQFRAWVSTARYSIEEVPPPIGIYRGCVNGDCFTKYAYGFTYAPSERTFFIFNEKREVMFTIYAMAVKQNGKHSLLLHEMGAGHANPTVVEQIVRAMHAKLPELGYEQIFIGYKGMHGDTGGQTQTRVAGGNHQYTTLTHYDTNARSMIGSFMVKNGSSTRYAGMGTNYATSHDLAGSHQYGYLFNPAGPNANFRIQASVHDASNFLAKYLGGVRSCAIMF